MQIFQMENRSENIRNVEKFIGQVLHEQQLIDSLIGLIAQSKRLLVDHVEELEACPFIADSQPIIATKSDRIKIITATGLTSAAAVSVIATKLMSCSSAIPLTISLGVAVTGICCFAKLTMKKIMSTRAVRSVLKHFNEVDVAVRKNISYIREAQFLDKSADKKQNDLAVHKCLHSIIETIKAIYEEISILEQIELTESVEATYQPMEDLCDCVYFQRKIEELTAENLKDFYNLFLFFQSQFLLRLCLVLIYESKSAFDYLQCRIAPFSHELRLRINELNVPLQLNDKKLTFGEHLQHQFNPPIEHTESVSLAKVKRGSSDIASRLVAVAHEFQSIENDIQASSIDCLGGKHRFATIAQRMNAVEEALHACEEDYRRLMLVFSKCMFTMFQLNVSSKPRAIQSTSVENKKDEIEKKDAAVKKAEDIDDEGDFFAIRDSEIESSDSDDDDDDDGDGDDEADDQKERKCGNFDDELESFDVKLTRSSFAPVLKQLKSKINPIKDAMKERELKFLMAKGIDRERILRQSSGNEIRADESDSGSDDSIETKPKRPNKYDQMRSELQEKQQISFLPSLVPPVKMVGDEDILE